MLKQDKTRKTACSALALKLFSFGRKKDGVVSIEAALLFPVMILLLLGMIDIEFTHPDGHVERRVCGSRSGRVAWQFFSDLAGRKGVTV